MGLLFVSLTCKNSFCINYRWFFIYTSCTKAHKYLDVKIEAKFCQYYSTYSVNQFFLWKCTYIYFYVFNAMIRFVRWKVLLFLIILIKYINMFNYIFFVIFFYEWAKRKKILSAFIYTSPRRYSNASKTFKRNRGKIEIYF